MSATVRVMRLMLAGMVPSAFDLGEVGDGKGGGADAVQEAQAVGAEIGLCRVHRHMVEELIDRLPELRHLGHGSFEVFARHRGSCSLLDLIYGLGESLFL